MGQNMKIGAIFKSIYFSNEPLTDKDYKNSRTFLIFEGASARIIIAITSGAFLAGFASYLGAGDSFNGIIGSIPVLTFIIQFLSPLVLEKMEKRKYIITILCLIHRLLLGSMLFVPFVVKGQTVRLAVVAVIYFISFLLASFITPAAAGLIIDLVPDNIRGRYFGARESYLLGATTVFTLIMGRVLDIFKNNGNEYGGFIVMFSSVFVLTLVNIIFLSSIKEPPVKRSKIELNLRKVVTIPLKDKKFRKIVLVFLLWNIGTQMGLPFFSVYMVTGLKLNYTYIMAVGMLGTLANTLVVRLWGRLADRKSWLFVLKLSILMLSLTHIAWFFVNTSTVYALVPFIHIAGGLSWAGIGISTFNIQFIYSPEEGRTVYIGFNAALSGLMGFLSTLLGSVLLILFSTLKISISSFTIGSMQIIFAISGLLLGVCAAYVHLFIKPESE
ncbi:MAG: MFS transporter [Ruminiclostridium sp.]|nr:MFS transporter [Ruminiclostridium sp.]